MKTTDLDAIVRDNLRIIDRIIEREGNTFSDRPSDRGGPTKYGITLKTLDAQDGIPGNQTAEDVRSLTLEQARALYAAEYVAPFALIRHAGVREALVDFGVHSGVPFAGRVLQRLLGVTVDGVVGPETIAAVEACDPERLRCSIHAARGAHLGRLITNSALETKETVVRLARQMASGTISATDRLAHAAAIERALASQQALNAAGWMNRLGNLIAGIE